MRFADFFTTIGTKSLWFIIGCMFLAYVLTYIMWAVVWFIVLRTSTECVVFAEDDESFLSAYLFSVELQVCISSYAVH